MDNNIKTQFNNAKGQRVTVYKDGTKTYGSTKSSSTRPGTPAPATSGMSNDGNNELMSLLQKRLLGEGGISSSSDRELEKTIAESISGAKEAGRVNTQRIQNDYEYMRDQAEYDASQNTQNFRESRSGFGTQMAALRTLVKETDSYMRDLDVRKQDALAANDVNTANAINQLQIERLKFRQEKEQQFYNNAFTLVGLDMEERAQKQAKYEFDILMQDRKQQRDIDLRDKMFSAATQAGVAWNPNDTYETLSVKIAAIADEERRISAQKALDSAASDDNELYYDMYLSDPSSFNSFDAFVRKAMVDLRGEGIQLTSDEGKNFRARAQEIWNEWEKTKSVNTTAQAGNFWEKIFKVKPRNFEYQTTPSMIGDVSTSTPKATPETIWGIPGGQPGLPRF